MTFLHGRWTRRASLLAAGALVGPERTATEEHLRACGRCRRSVADVALVLDAMSRDPLRVGEPGLSTNALVTRVRARIDREPRPRSWIGIWATAAGVLAVLAAAIALNERPPLSRSETASVSPAAPETLDRPALRRLERTVTREQAVRFLSDARDVLVTMAAETTDCDRDARRVDVAAEARRSREILARRTLLLEVDHADVASARPLLEDVEHVLREVASLESCVRADEVERVRREMARRRLLMKIRLISRELQG